MKIKTLTLDNFRAFPGPQTFTLNGKNLLVYRENGSGKSSVFHALKTFFSNNDLGSGGETCNIFSRDEHEQKITDHWIEVEFDDGTQAVRWTGPPPVQGWPGDNRVREAARRRGCLDYRALLDTNYRHSGGEINLFEIAIDHLLPDFRLFGAPPTVGNLWADVLASKPQTNRAEDVRPAEEACEKFNTLFGIAVDAVYPVINSLLPKLAADGVQLNRLVFANVAYDKSTRDFANKRLIPEISFLDNFISHPHDFLNEARLSAIGLAIYLAGRLTSVPTDDDELKLLVLDDVLIGIDLTNRLPLLDLLRKRFSDWQIVLLTHDKNWFDIAALYVEEGNTWVSTKIFEGSRNGSFSVPVVVPSSKSEREIALDKATKFADQREYQAAANYARSAYEATLRVFSDRHSVPIPFEADQRHPDYEAMLGAIELWLTEKNERVFYATKIERTKIFRRIILNPLSHADTTAVEFEVRGAIKAVKALDEVVGKKFKIDPNWKLLGEVRNAAAKPTPTNFDLQMALANLRAKFAWSLRQFCERHSVKMPFTVEPPSTFALWERVHAEGVTLFVGTNAGLETLINAKRDWLIEEIDRTKLPDLTLLVLQQLITLLNPNNDEKTVLDVI